MFKGLKTLVINAENLRINSSANLCHIAYINGLLSAGHDVDLLFASNRGKDDISIIIPDKANVICYDGLSLYEKFSLSRSETVVPCLNKDETISSESNIKNKESVKTKIKRAIQSYYGVFWFYRTFVKRASKYRSKKTYDYVISLSSPPASHLLAYKLIKKKHIKCKNWIQIWEDPWSRDLYTEYNKKIEKQEKKLLSVADKVCYVTPLTLANQQKFFKEFADKMFWQPLPSYYKNENHKKQNEKDAVFGYFGDYFAFSRNLAPFYEAAVEQDVETYICGNPSDLFESKNKVKIMPRMPLAELKTYEDKANVLVFVCNLGGGQVPGKIYQYSSTNKRILFILDGSEEEKRILKEYFSQFNRYYFCDNTVEDIKSAIKDIKQNKNTNIKNEPIEYFEPQNIVKRILESV